MSPEPKRLVYPPPPSISYNHPYPFIHIPPQHIYMQPPIAFHPGHSYNSPFQRPLSESSQIKEVKIITPDIPAPR